MNQKVSYGKNQLRLEKKYEFFDSTIRRKLKTLKIAVYVIMLSPIQKISKETKRKNNRYYLKRTVHVLLPFTQKQLKKNLRHFKRKKKRPKQMLKSKIAIKGIVVSVWEQVKKVYELKLDLSSYLFSVPFCVLHYNDLIR